MSQIVLSLIVSAFLAHWTPGDMVGRFNDRFMASVDSAESPSCWERVEGTIGKYREADDYMLNVGCVWEKIKP